jgi:ATP-dependent exoDNAse (exonuclease V) alpha subunit
LVTGAAGTGKSFTLRQAIRRLRQRHGAEMIYVTASTGTAAFNIGGITVHSFAGIGMGTGTIRQLVDKVEASPACANWQTARCLVIDEVSMLDGKLFDTLEEVARGVRGNSAPFGGLQVVVFGDFYQLPPVSLQVRCVCMSDLCHTHPIHLGARLCQQCHLAPSDPICPRSDLSVSDRPLILSAPWCRQNR